MFVEIPNYPKYKINESGEILSFKFKQPHYMKIRRDKDGYHTVGLCGEDKKQITCRVHALVLITFKGVCPKGYQGAHLDGNKDNNHISNLAWVTPKENSYHRTLHGTQMRGETHHKHKLTEKDVLAIRSIYKDRIPYKRNKIRYKDVAETYNIDTTLVGYIVRNKIWAYLPQSKEI